MLRIAIVLGSVRDDRQAPKAGKFARASAEARGWQVSFIDPLDYKLPLLNKMYKEMENPEPVFKKLHDIFEKADGFLLVTAEYNHSVPPALKNMLDHYQKEFYWKPSAIISYSAGSFGGVRACQHLRHICTELGMPSISSEYPIPNIGKTINENGEPADATSYQKRMKRFLDEFEWYMQAFRNQREKGVPY